MSERVILAGLGEWGAGWYAALCERFGPGAVAVVDPDPAAAARMARGGAWFGCLRDALEGGAKPEFLINSSPPRAHTAINLEAIAAGLPILCEKPISPSPGESRRVVRAARDAGVPFMVAENFRRDAVMRRAALIFREGKIGELASVHGQLFQHYETSKPYWAASPDAFLQDVVIHVLDLIRFFTADEGASIFARSYNPIGSWHPTNAAVCLLMETHRGIQATFDGGLASRGGLTSWRGDWRLEGTRGAILIRGSTVRVSLPDVETGEDTATISAPGCLEDFLAYLNGDPHPQTLGEDYLRTEDLLAAAMESARSGLPVRMKIEEDGMS
ncbi:MAG: Gfo/Idh/MocA family oxidoreductase [Sumerlaeia bacterium]